MPAESLPLMKGTTTWWHHEGLGPGATYVSLRVGRDEPETTGVVYVPVPEPVLAGCRIATASMRIEHLDTAMKAKLEVRVIRMGRLEENPEKPVDKARSVTEVASEISKDVIKVQVGLGATGHGEIAASGLTFTCENKRPIVLNLRDAIIDSDLFSIGNSLYERGVRACGSGSCIYVKRRTTGPRQSMIDVAVGEGLQLRMPVVLGVTGGRTSPAPDRRVVSHGDMVCPGASGRPPG